MPSNITPQRVPLVDTKTGLITTEWYRFFISLFELTGNGQNSMSLTDILQAPPTIPYTAATDTTEVSLAEDGYIKFPSGLILQWGFDVTTGSPRSVTFPTAFPTACVNWVATQSSAAYIIEAASISTTGATLRVYDSSGGLLTGSVSTFWQAIGY